LPFSIHSSAIAMPANGAMYCCGAGSEAEALTTVT
jgi:hypothetical protein